MSKNITRLFISFYFFSSPLLFIYTQHTSPLSSSPPFSPLFLLCVSVPLLRGSHTGRGNLRPQLDSAMQDVSDLYLLMEETEKQAVRRALLEERGRYCTFINMLQPVVVRDTVSFCHVFKKKNGLVSLLMGSESDLFHPVFPFRM